MPAFTARVTGALERVVAAHEGRATAVVVAHAGVINTWLAHLLGIARPLAFPLDYAGITRVVAARDGRRSVRTVNEIAHVADLLAPVAGTTEGLIAPLSVHVHSFPRMAASLRAGPLSRGKRPDGTSKRRVRTPEATRVGPD